MNIQTREHRPQLLQERRQIEGCERINRSNRKRSADLLGDCFLRAVIEIQNLHEQLKQLFPGGVKRKARP